MLPLSLGESRRNIKVSKIRFFVAGIIPLKEGVLGLYNEISKEERNLAKIGEINNRDPPPSWLAGPTSLLGESFSEVSSFILNIIRGFEADKNLARFVQKLNPLSGHCLQIG